MIFSILTKIETESKKIRGSLIINKGISEIQHLKHWKLIKVSYKKKDKKKNFTFVFYKNDRREY
jgi:hypothetical protein